MAYKYNQLLKLNLQKDTEPDLSPIEAEISDLQQKKVTKFFSANDTLEDGEVAEYQGTDDAVNGLENGYFYKVAVYNFPTGSQYFKYLDGQPTINLNGYNFAPGDYYIIRQVDVVNTSFFDYTLYYYGDHQYYRVGIGNWCNIGDIIFDNDNTLILTVTAKSEHVVTLSNGVTFNESPSYGGVFSTLYDCITADGKIYSILLSNMGKMVVHYNINGNQFNLIDWFYVNWVFQYTSETPLNVKNFTCVDTQPRTPGVTVVDGVLQISLPVEFSGNITVHGSEVVVTTEQIQSENDFIKLRYNNPLALAAGETSGISVNNYDGNDTDCILAVDIDGWARVGDSSGTLEKIATIEETPTDAQFVQYDAQNKQLKTAAIPEATTTTAGLMSANDKSLINNNLTESHIIINFVEEISASYNICYFGKLVIIYLSSLISSKQFNIYNTLATIIGLSTSYNKNVFATLHSYNSNCSIYYSETAHELRARTILEANVEYFGTILLTF